MSTDQPQKGSHLDRLRPSERRPYIWHVEQRGADWFAVHQFGGWLRKKSPEAAQACIDRSVERFGDTDRDAAERNEA